MNCQNSRERMAELADARLDETAARAVREHMDGCPSCAAEFASLTRTLGALDALPASAPSHRLRAAVMGHIETEKLSLRNQPEWAPAPRASRGVRPTAWGSVILRSLGVCTLIVLGFMLGERAATQRQLAEIRAKVDVMGQLVEQSVLQKRTSGDRLETVMAAAVLRKPDERVIDGLINALAFDPSVNVRLNALSALYAHADQEVVRAGVLACLSRESNPLIEVSMIDFLVASKAREAAPELRKLASDEKVNADVRDSARRAIDLL